MCLWEAISLSCFVLYLLFPVLLCFVVFCLVSHLLLFTFHSLCIFINVSHVDIVSPVLFCNSCSLYDSFKFLPPSLHFFSFFLSPVAVLCLITLCISCLCFPLCTQSMKSCQYLFCEFFCMCFSFPLCTCVFCFWAWFSFSKFGLKIGLSLALHWCCIDFLHFCFSLTTLLTVAS